MWSSSGVKIFGEATGVFCFVAYVVYISPLDADVCLSWWVVFPADIHKSVRNLYMFMQGLFFRKVAYIRYDVTLFL
jgi:hypothetical protein